MDHEIWPVRGDPTATCRRRVRIAHTKLDAVGLRSKGGDCTECALELQSHGWMWLDEDPTAWIVSRAWMTSTTP